MTTFYRWQNDFEQIREAIKKGKAPVDIQVENALLKRALGYEYTETKIKREIIGFERGKDGKQKPIYGKQSYAEEIKKHVPADVTAQIYWLKNRRRGVWCDRPPEIDNTETGESDGFIEALSATAAEDWADES